MQFRTAFVIPTFLLLATAASGQYSSRVIYGQGTPGEVFAQRCTFTGDVDGDGFEDVLIGTPNATAGGFFHAGEVRVVSGANGSVLYAITGTAGGQNVGYSISAAHDIDNDGRSDFMLYTGGQDPISGALSDVTVYSGATGLPLRTYVASSAAWAFVGLSERALAPAGDIDGDGAPDLLLGAGQAIAPSGAVTGAVHAVSGASGGVLYSWFGDDSHELFGNSVSSAGDVNADGCDDVIVGAEFDQDFGLDAGSATILDGLSGAPIQSLSAGVTLEFFGVCVAGLGDVDGDAFSDVAIGTGVIGSKARVYRGGAWTILHVIQGAPSTYFGNTLASAGDHDGDGRNDLIIGAVNSSPVGQYSGRAFLHSGATGTLLRSFHGNGPFERFGSMVAGGGDSNADGRPDLLIAAPGNGTGPLPGAAHLFESACQTLYGYGKGCPGAGGFVPRLEVSGCVSSGPGSLTISLDHAYGGQLAVFVAGLEPTWAQAGHGCSVLVLPTVVPAAMAVLSGLGPGNGTVGGTLAVDSMQLPMDVYAQAFCGEPAPWGFSASNAILIGTPQT